MLHTYTVRRTSGCQGLVDVTVRVANGDIKVLQNVVAVYHKNDGTITVQTNPGSYDYWDRSTNVIRNIRIVLDVSTAASLVLGGWVPNKDQKLARASALALEILADSAAHRGVEA
jgi:hypothetical protein